MYIILEVEPHQPRTHFTGLEINIFDLKMVVKSGQEPELLLLKETHQPRKASR